MGSCGGDVSDIEDLAKDFDSVDIQRVKRNTLVPRIRKKKKGEQDIKEEKIVCDSIIPGTQKIYVKTWGCSHNNSDSEYMSGLLAAYGYNLTEEASSADLWLLNSCTVKGPAEDHFRNAVEAGLEQRKHVVVAGCVPQSAPRASYLKGLSIIGVQQIDRVVEVVEEALKGHTVRLFGQKKQSGKKLGGASLSLPKVRKNPLVEIIPISTGCLNQCTYCKTKHARGELGSYPVEEIIQRAVQAFQEGVREIWLTSEDTGAYGRDIGNTLPELMFRLVQVIPDNCFVRLGMTNPPYILDHLEEMAKLLSHPRVYSFLHIPVQSASDAVLSDMKREYCRQDFEKIVDYLRERVPGISIATDIICGFPTETNQDFEETVDLVQKYRFPSLFINQFYPRPGTPAARMPRIPAQEVKRRTKHLSEVFQGYQTNGHHVGSTQEVLVTELSHDKKHYVGHNKFYDQVLIPMEERFMGQTVQVKITSAGKHWLTGEPLHVVQQESALHISTSLSTTQLRSGQKKTEEIICEPWFASLWWWSCIAIVVTAFFVRLFGNRLSLLLF